MPRHDRAHGVYQQPGRAGGNTSRRTRGPKNTYAGKQQRAPFVHATVPLADSRQGGNTPKPNAPKPQTPKPNPKAPR